MKSSMMWWGALTLLLAGLSGCGGDDSSAPPVPPAGGSTAQIIAAAAADPTNDTSTNSSASFTVMQSTAVPAVVVNSPPVVNFTVFSDGRVVQGLTNANVRFAIAKLTPGSEWQPGRLGQLRVPQGNGDTGCRAWRHACAAVGLAGHHRPEHRGVTRL